MLFVNRTRELDRLGRAFDLPAHAELVCVWGRRRLGKSRLLREAVAGRPTVWMVGDARGPALQREELAREIGRVLAGFDSVKYPRWDALLERLWRDAPAGLVLVLDEFPELVATSPELPGVLQKLVDGRQRGPHVAVCGSSQHMMQGLVLDASAPLYGRAREILRIEPMAPRWLAEALQIDDPIEAVVRYAVFGGVPRYWELSEPFATAREAATELVLDPLGVLHDEPARLLLDDLSELARAATLLALVGAGVARLSEIAARVGQPASALTRPLARLVELGLVARETPFGVPPRDSKRSHYVIGDALLAFWFRFVEPNRSRLGAGALDTVVREVWADFPVHLGHRWERMVRDRIGAAPVAGGTWSPASRWWGPTRDGGRVELDAVAEGADGRVLVAEAKLSVDEGEVPGLLRDLEARAARCPALAGRVVVPTIWALRGPEREDVLGPAEVLERPR